MSARLSALLPASLLRAHVGGGAQEHSGAGHLRGQGRGQGEWRALQVARWPTRDRRIERFGEPEVEDLDVAVLVDLDVGRLEIAVDDAVLVGGSRELRRSARRWAVPRRRDRPRSRSSLRVVARGELHDEEVELAIGAGSSRPGRDDPAIFGWLSAASTLASRSKRARRSGSCATASGSTLIATSRPSLVSSAR